MEGDKGQVEIVGTAAFDTKDSGDNTVTFTASGLSRAKAQNYALGETKTATATAKIEQLKVDFVIGQTSFVYDGKEKAITATANGNYTGTQTATLVINKAAATGSISGVKDSYTYGDEITGISAAGLDDGTTAAITYAGTGIYVPQEEAPSKVGNYTAIAEITGDNYETLTVTKSFTIEKKELTVKAKDTTRVYGEANPIFELDYTGFVNGEKKTFF